MKTKSKNMKDEQLYNKYKSVPKPASSVSNYMVIAGRDYVQNEADKINNSF